MTAAEVCGPSIKALARELVDVAAAAARAGARVSLAAWQERAHLAVGTKAGPDDLVTEADLRTQEAVFEVLAARRPADVLRGEEQIDRDGSSEPAAGAVEWWVDPIDGTTSFVYGRADWSVSVAAVDRQTGLIVAAAVSEPVLGTTTTAAIGCGAWSAAQRLRVRPCDDLARALVDVNLGTAAQRVVAGQLVGRLADRVRDIRRGGSAALALVGVATGRSDAAWVPGLQAWDGAAGLLIAAEAGATVGDLTGATQPQWPVSGDVLAAAPPVFDELRALLVPVYGAADAG
jgi:myo-inositol-1(or 4)-monophosphatase